MSSGTRWYRAALLFGYTLIVAAVPASAATLDDVKAKGFLECGVNHGLPGFSSSDEKGNWRGMDVDICRGLAAAIFADMNKVKFVPLTAKERFTALQSGEVDILSRNTTWTMTRDTALGLNFAGVTYYDGQGFMVRKKLGISSALELSGSTICTQSGTTTEMNADDYFNSRKMAFKLLTFAKTAETVQAYEAGECDAFTSDTSQLYAFRLKLADPDAHMVLPEIISKEPLGPVVRQGDDQWFNLVKWTVFALIDAEELGISSANVEEMRNSENPVTRRLLGLNGDLGRKLGLDNSWAVRLISSIGNYGEVFDRNVGKGSPLNIARGVNRLWNMGGIQYAPPVR
jgi:general L-amino acid transport system substrate-binding protein